MRYLSGVIIIMMSLYGCSKANIPETDGHKVEEIKSINITDSPGNKEPVPSVTLKQITFSIIQNVSISSEGLPSGMAVELQGDLINKNVLSFSIEKKEVYSSPLDCCVAILQAKIQEDEAWYGALAAPVDKRGPDGAPKEDYVPDSDKNLYNFLTYYKVDPQFPRVIDYNILSYFPMGNIHCFRIEFTRKQGEEISKAISVVDIEQFAGKYYRYAPELITTSSLPSIFNLFGILIPESKEQQEFRTQFPERHYTITVQETSTTDESPLRLSFRGGFPDDQPEYQQVATAEERINELLQSFGYGNPTEQDYINSDARKELTTLFDSESIENLDKSGMVTRSSIFPIRDIFIVDGKDLFLAFFTDKNGQVMKDMHTFHRQDEKIIRINYAYT